MKRIACVLVLLALASSAHASGVALRWGSCEGTSNRNFACDRSTYPDAQVVWEDSPDALAILRLPS